MSDDNEALHETLREALRQSAAGEVVDLGDFTQYADDEIPEADATPDEAYELGYTAGFDQAAEIAADWLFARFGGTEVADEFAEHISELVQKIGEDELKKRNG